jgi:hypothetical protein
MPRTAAAIAEMMIIISTFFVLIDGAVVAVAFPDALPAAALACCISVLELLIMPLSAAMMELALLTTACWVGGNDTVTEPELSGWLIAGIGVISGSWLYVPPPYIARIYFTAIIATTMSNTNKSTTPKTRNALLLSHDMSLPTVFRSLKKLRKLI